MTEPLEITELTGSERSISLNDRALPFRPVSFAGEQRFEKTSYPGNPVSTIQVLGPDETGAEFSGRWKDRYLTARQMVTLSGWDSIISSGENVTVEGLVKVFHALRRSGNLLRVTWASETRHGILKRFEPVWHRLDVAEWTATFEWTQIGETPPSPFTSARSSTSSATTDLTSSLSDFDDVLAQMPSFAMPDIILQAISLGATVASSVVDLVTSIALVTGVPEVTTTQFQGIASYASTVVSSCDALRLIVGDAPPAMLCPTDDVASLLACGAWGHDMSSALVALAAAAVAAREAMRDRAVPDYVADIRLREGQTLRDVAREYYGSGDSWGVIADANGLIGSLQPPGTRVLVPRREGRAA